MSAFRQVFLKNSVRFLLPSMAVFLTSVAVAQRENSYSILTDRVTFKTPVYWKSFAKKDSTKLAAVFMSIFYKKTNKTPHSADALVIAKAVEDTVDIEKLTKELYSKTYPGMVIVNDIQDGNYWRTILWTAFDKGVQYINMNRFGCMNGIAVEALVSFPMLRKGDSVWEKMIIEDFNAFCASLKIDNQNSSEAKIFVDKIPPSLRKSRE